MNLCFIFGGLAANDRVFMKIANIVCVYPPYKGGIGTAAFNFRRAMAEKGHEVTTFTPDYGLEEGDGKDGVVRLSPWLKLGNGAFVPGLFWKLKDFDVLYLHYSFFGGMEVVWLAKMVWPKKKLIIRYHMDVHGLSLPARILSLPSGLISGSLFRKADLIVSAGLDYVETGPLKDLYKSDRGRFAQIPYGVDTDEFRPREKDRQIFKILFVGGLDRAHYFKGVDNLLEAASGLSGKNWKLNIVGSGNMENEYKEKAVRLGISDKVVFLGKVSDEDLPGVYAQSHITVLPSTARGEAFGIVLIESMASGTPIVASDLPGVRSVFKDGKQGLAAKPNNVGELKGKIETLLNDEDKLKEMEKDCRELAEKRYSLKSVGDELDRVLKEF